MESQLIPQKLITRSLAGDEQARSDLGDALRQLVRSFLTRRGVRDSEADVLSVECAGEIVSAIERYCPSHGSMESWAMGFAVKMHLRHLRDKRQRLVRETPLDDLSEASLPSVQWSESLHAIELALADLDPVTLEILRLKFVEQQNSDEIGAELHLSAEAVRKRLSRTGEKLRNEPGVRRFYLS